jgi:hypothetical protein
MKKRKPRCWRKKRNGKRVYKLALKPRIALPSPPIKNKLMAEVATAVGDLAA